MKVCRTPAEVPTPRPDYSNYDWKKEAAKEEAHQVALAKWLRDNGYTGPHTGKVFQTPVADGYARYMLGDKGKGGVLVHLDYGDGYHSRDVEFLPKKEVLARIEQRERLASLFSKGA